MKKINYAKIGNKGFSLVEILTSVVIGAVVLLGVTAFMNGSSQSYRTATTQIALQDDVQETLNYLTTLAQRAMAVEWNNGEDLYYIFAPKADTETKTYEVIYVMYDPVKQSLYIDKKDVLDHEYETGLKLTPSQKSARCTQQNLLATDLEDFRMYSTGHDDTKKDVYGKDINVRYIDMVYIESTFRKNNKSRTEMIAVRPRNRRWSYENPSSDMYFSQVIQGY